MGPVVSEAQFNKIQSLIEKGIAEGKRPPSSPEAWDDPPG